MRAPKKNRKATFFWQALLIVLPIIVLAIVGFLSLRQDKLFAQKEAQERAQAIADELRTQLWTAVTNGEAQAGPPAPFRFQVDNAGQLIFPPPVAAFPQPVPFNIPELNRDQARLWQQAQKAETEINNPAEAAKACNDFLSLAPPKNFAAAATYTLGLLLGKQGDRRAAVNMFRLFTNKYPDAVGESGLPLAPLAQLKLLQLETNRPIAERRLWLDSFCSNLVYQPMPLTGHLLAMIPLQDNVSSLKAISDKWHAIWQQNERERQLYAVACSQFGRGPLAFRRADELVLVPKRPPRRAWGLQPSSSLVLLTESVNTGDSNAPSPRLLWFTTSEPWPDGLTNTFQLRTNSIPSSPMIDLEWLALRNEANSTSWWFVCQTVPEVGRALTRVLDRWKQVPDYFGIGFTLDGRTFARDAFALRLWMEHHYGGKGGGWDKEYSGEVVSDSEVLGSAALEEVGQELLRVNVYLTSPSTLFSRQRARTFWFSLLIAASAGAALIGLAAA